MNRSSWIWIAGLAAIGAYGWAQAQDGAGDVVYVPGGVSGEVRSAG